MPTTTESADVRRLRGLADVLEIDGGNTFSVRMLRETADRMHELEQLVIQQDKEAQQLGQRLDSFRKDFMELTKHSIFFRRQAE